ncbi:MAG TPA: universal stress protein [Pirellulales bacterium]
MPSSKTILFATDYSESANHALTYAASLARDRGAKLLIVHVSELEQYPVGELFDEEPRPSDEELAKLQAMAPPDHGVACEYRLLYGDPADEIVKLADAEQAEAIVIGTHDRSRLARLLSGSTAEKLLRTAHCPVIAYRAPLATALASEVAQASGTAPVAADESERPGARQADGRPRPAARGHELRRTVRTWTAHRPQLYGVFNKHGIDVVLDGDKRLADVCREKGLDPRHLADDLAASARPAYRETGTDWYQMSIAELCDHIESTHHNYLRRELPRLCMLVAEVDKDGRDQFPSLEELTQVFDDFRRQLMDHVEAEETALFPALRALDTGDLPVGSDIVDHYDLVDRMRDEHEQIGVELLHIRRLTNGYAPPRGASDSYRAMIGGLWELEANLQLAMREEDEILFAKALVH